MLIHVGETRDIRYFSDNYTSITSAPIYTCSCFPLCCRGCSFYVCIIDFSAVNPCRCVVNKLGFQCKRTVSRKFCEESFRFVSQNVERKKQSFVYTHRRSIFQMKISFKHLQLSQRRKTPKVHPSELKKNLIVPQNPLSCRCISLITLSWRIRGSLCDQSWRRAD